ncbi:MAG: RNA polymerase subunit sigma-70 [Planctomycetota bacterium]|nr:MAG: RNA polymerase subunit sigma-70 [Planctomycetota bacterium]REJ97480.1 MAG: RNA polymerase subunit sigma-70 [Planctomycetota bacterium]REK20968.1 MAG: RNA polymerase subunit sigma-70 [Planctomycetota bacterium]REK37250.1 MAG: RNA polymerase subunit sigma-70 [Planctomycetota bacterium]
MSDIDGSVTRVFRQMAGGDREAAALLWRRFFPRLNRVAAATLAKSPIPAVGAEDAVQSAFVSFWQRVESGQIGDDLSRDDLWSLLAVITKRKALRSIAREHAQKRGGGKVRVAADLKGAEGQSFRLNEVVAEFPTQEFDLVCEELLRLLDEEIRVIVLLRFMGHTNKEAARLLESTERRIERKLDLARQIWRRELACEE